MTIDAGSTGGRGKARDANESVRAEVSAAESACHAVLAPQRQAIERVAAALDATGSLSGARLIAALVDAEAVEAIR